MRKADCISLVAVVLLAACGMLPSKKTEPTAVPAQQAETPSAEEVQPPASEVPTAPRESRPGRASPQSRVQPSVRRPAAPAAQTKPGPAPFVCPADDPVSGRKHYFNGIEALGRGDPDRGRTQLSLALCKEPGDETARSVLSQIDGPVSEFFSRESFDYTVQPGDSLSGICQKFFGDPFLFYALARFNGIDNPSQLKAGQVVRVPRALAGGTPSRVVPEAAAVAPEKPTPEKPEEEKPAPTPTPEASAPSEAAAEASPPSSPDTAAPSVSAEPAAGDYAGPVTVVLRARDDRDPAPTIYYTTDGREPNARSARYQEPLKIEVTATVKFLAIDAAGNASPVTVVTYRIGGTEVARARELAAAGRYEEAIGLLEKRLAQGKDDEARTLLVATCFEYAQALRKDGKPQEAQGILERGLAVQPNDPALQKALASVQKDVAVDRVYVNGLQAFDRGELENAYAAFQQTLELDPGHAAAKQKLEEVKQALVSVNSKRAMAAFRRQDLDEAIRRWDQVLSIDPENEMAKLRRAEAQELKERFEERFEGGAKKQN